jgi:hypothetical protein
LLTVKLQAQPTPPRKGYRLHRVRRLRPAPLPPGGLVPFRDTAAGAWGLADTLGQPYVRAEFAEPLAFPGRPFLRLRWFALSRVENGGFRRHYLEWRQGYEMWLNARGEYLLAPIGQAAYRQPDGSLHARSVRYHLRELQYGYEQALAGRPHTDSLREAWLVEQGRIKARGLHLYPVRPLGEGLYSLLQPMTWWRFRHRLHQARRLTWYTSRLLLTSVDVPELPQCLSTIEGRRLTPYRYHRLYSISSNRIRFIDRQSAEGFLDRRGRSVLGPYLNATDFNNNRAVVALPGADGLHPRYALIDTTGKYLIAPMAGTLHPPDEADLLLHSVEQPEGQVWEYLQLDGQPAFPSHYFREAGAFRGGSARAVDASGRAGTLRRDGRWQPAP